MSKTDTRFFLVLVALAAASVCLAGNLPHVGIAGVIFAVISLHFKD
jgi:hypothetical protein